MSKLKSTLYLIDGTSFCYRAYYAIRELSTSKGVPTNAIYGVVNMLRKLIKEYEPEMVTVVFDMKGPTTRHKKYENYKIHRKPMPDDLSEQIPRIKEVVEAFNIPVFQLEGYEADDIIATLAEKARGKGINVTIVTGDKDAMQLVDEKVKVLSPYALDESFYDREKVRDKFGVYPERMVELMALAGDPSDNVPGVKGIGKVTAEKLISEYGNIENIYKNVEKIKPESVRKKLLEGKKMAELSRELVILDRNVPVKLDVDKAVLSEPDWEKLEKLFREFEFQKLLRALIPEEEKAPELSTAGDEGAAEKALDRILKKKLVALSVAAEDEERRLSGVSFSCGEGKAVHIPLQKTGKVFNMVKSVLEDETVEKVGYDLKKSLGVLRQNGIEMRGMTFDVMIAEYLLDPSRPDHPGEESCEAIFGAYKELWAELEDKKLMPLFRDVEMPLIEVLADMESEGVGIDVPCLKKMSKDMEKKLSEITEKIYDLSGENFNINSPKQLQSILFDKLGLPKVKKTKTGFSTDESVLRRLSKEHELPSALLEYRAMNKLKTGYYDSLLELVDAKTGILHASFNQAVTATGRLSSSEPNLQNIPIKTAMGKELRRAFIPGEKGKLLLAADYSQIELRILAHLSDDKELIKAFNKGEDVHLYTASRIFGCSISDVTEEMRAVAKTVNFGIIYGMSPFRLARDLEIDLVEAQRFIDSYFDQYSGVKAFIDKTIKVARKKGYVTTLLNRRRYIPEITSSNERIKGFAERVAVNTPVQGSAADLIKLAMIACHDRLRESGTRMIIQVHDELVFKVPENRINNAVAAVQKIMEGVIDLKVPLKVHVEAGPNWMDMEEIK